MLLGKEIRLSRIFNQASGKMLAVAMDHGISFSYDVPRGIRRIRETLARVIEGAPDAVLFHKGIAAKCFGEHAGRTSLIVQATAFAPHNVHHDYQIACVEEALTLGADALAVCVTVGGDSQGELLTMLANVVKEASVAGMPVLAHIYPKGNLVKEDERLSVKYVSYCARVGAEVGVDAVKTSYTGSVETFREVVETTPIPVVAAGGPRLETTRDVLAMAKGVIEAGGAGLVYGRNVWEANDPVALLRALKMVTHEGAGVEEAMLAAGS